MVGSGEQQQHIPHHLITSTTYHPHHLTTPPTTTTPLFASNDATASHLNNCDNSLANVSSSSISSSASCVVEVVSATTSSTTILLPTTIGISSQVVDCPMSSSVIALSPEQAALNFSSFPCPVAGSRGCNLEGNGQPSNFFGEEPNVHQIRVSNEPSSVTSGSSTSITSGSPSSVTSGSSSSIISGSSSSITSGSSFSITSGSSSSFGCNSSSVARDECFSFQESVEQKLYLLPYQPPQQQHYHQLQQHQMLSDQSSVAILSGQSINDLVNQSMFDATNQSSNAGSEGANLVVSGATIHYNQDHSAISFANIASKNHPRTGLVTALNPSVSSGPELPTSYIMRETTPVWCPSPSELPQQQHQHPSSSSSNFSLPEFRFKIKDLGATYATTSSSSSVPPYSVGSQQLYVEDMRYHDECGRLRGLPSEILDGMVKRSHDGHHHHHVTRYPQFHHHHSVDVAHCLPVVSPPPCSSIVIQQSPSVAQLPVGVRSLSEDSANFAAAAASSGNKVIHPLNYTLKPTCLVPKQQQQQQQGSGVEMFPQQQMMRQAKCPAGAIEAGNTSLSNETLAQSGPSFSSILSAANCPITGLIMPTVFPHISPSSVASNFASSSPILPISLSSSLSMLSSLYSSNSSPSQLLGLAPSRPGRGVLPAVYPLPIASAHLPSSSSSSAATNSPNPLPSSSLSPATSSSPSSSSNKLFYQP